LNLLYILFTKLSGIFSVYSFTEPPGSDAGPVFCATSVTGCWSGKLSLSAQYLTAHKPHPSWRGWLNVHDGVALPRLPAEKKTIIFLLYKKNNRRVFTFIFLISQMSICWN
jgi:hypothetical protein